MFLFNSREHGNSTLIAAFDIEMKFSFDHDQTHTKDVRKVVETSDQDIQ
jgi:hypothetical protein